MATPHLTSSHPSQPLPYVVMRRDKVEKYRDWGNGGYCSGKVACGSGNYKKVYKVELYPSRQVVAVAKIKYLRSFEIDSVMNEVAMHQLFSQIDNVMPLHQSMAYFSTKMKADRALYVMPYCIYNLTNAPFSADHKTKLLLEVCTGISGIHKLDYVISDLKGLNIMIEKRGNDYHPLLGDLAAVFPEKSPPSPSKMLVTWTHTSPEGAKRRYGGKQTYDQPLPKVTRAHDMWSLSILLYECWTATKYENCRLPTFKMFALHVIYSENSKAAELIPSVVEEFKTTFTMNQVVADLIKNGLNVDPAARGTIENFISVLQPVLYPPAP